MSCPRGVAVLSLAACTFRPGGAAAPLDAAHDAARMSTDAAAAHHAADAANDAAAPPSCLQRWAANDVAFDAGTLLPNVNARGFDTRDPFVSFDQLTLYFDSSRPGGIGGYDLWVSTRASIGSDFPAAVDLPGPVNSSFDESKLATTKDGLDAVFSSDRPSASTGYQLWESTRSGSAAVFGSASQTDELAIDVAGNEYDPWLDADGDLMYFAPASSTGQHVSFATRTAGSAFGSLTEVTELEGSGFEEADPTLSPDELLVIFTSTRGSGVGLADLWYATRANASDPFGPVQLVPDVNTPNTEGDAHLTADGCLLYFTSDRDNGGDGAEIYLATMQ